LAKEITEEPVFRTLAEYIWAVAVAVLVAQAELTAVLIMETAVTA
jgi:hypothetical protein